MGMPTIPGLKDFDPKSILIFMLNVMVFITLYTGTRFLDTTTGQLQSLTTEVASLNKNMSEALATQAAHTEILRQYGVRLFKLEDITINETPSDRSRPHSKATGSPR